MPPHKLDALVELADQYSDVYPNSPTGARGWVRARRELPKADPEVFIEWDKAHWRYHGEKDGWTFEHHFKCVDDMVPPPSNAAMPTMDTILSEASRRAAGETGPQPDPDAASDNDADFIDTLMEAQEAAVGADGYFIITVTPRAEGGFTYFEPQIFHQYLTPTAQGLIDAQLVHIATQLFEGHMISRIDEIEGNH